MLSTRELPYVTADLFALCDELWSSIEKSETVARRTVPTDMRIALTLWFLATSADYRTICHLFGVSKSTICLVTEDVCFAIVKFLLPRYVKVSCRSSLREIIDGFEHDLGFLHRAGAVDRSHILIISPHELGRRDCRERCSYCVAWLSCLSTFTMIYESMAQTLPLLHCQHLTP